MNPKSSSMLTLLIPSIFLVVLSVLAAPAADDILIADFEASHYGGWQTTGEAFGPGPARGALPRQMKVEGFQGQGLVNTFFNGDRSTGTLTSPPFNIQRRFIRFLIGGGQHPGKACINLLVGGKVVRTATGPNDRPGGSEQLDLHQWDVSELIGQTATIQIVDLARTGWGHINIDHIIQTDRNLPKLLIDVTQPLQISKRYLNLPVKNGAPSRRVSLLVDNQAVREFTIELADAEPDFWVFLDLAPFAGKSATLKIDRLSEESQALQSIHQADAITGAENLYREPLRPQFHFSSRRGWNNDPNGLVFYKGEYHLYYQHNPYGWKWGNMHWGHAVSPDLVRWRELPIALYPRQFGDWAYSGSAVVDALNTAGFKTGAEDVIVAAFTSTGRGECIAFSNDRGRTFTEFSGNPVVTHKGRDPRLFWHAPTSRWVMAVYDELDVPRDPDKARDRERRAGIAFYTSPDLKQWTLQSRIAGFYECPDIFELPVDGDRANTRWVLTAASSEYMVGRFDGKTFTPETPKLPGHRGAGFYAAQTYSDIPPDDGRRIQIGWGQMPSPGMPFNQMMAFPCELNLRTLPEGIRLCFQPVRELDMLHGKKHAWSNTEFSATDNPLARIRGELFDLRVELEPLAAKSITLTIRGVPVVYDALQQTISCEKKTNPLPLTAGKLRLQILADRTSLEIFANDGALYMPLAVAFPPDARPLALTADGRARLHSLDVYELKSAWEQKE